MLTRQEFGRQLLHAAIGLAAVLFIYLDILTSWSLFLLIIVGCLTSMLSKRIHLPFFSFFLHHFEREEQKATFPGKGMIFFFVGVLLAIQLFDQNIALAAIMVLALGDSVSHIIGAQFGKLRNIFNIKSKKLFEGTVAGTIAGFIGAASFVPIPEAFLGSFAAMIAEVIQIDLNETTLDDNMIVPLVAGTVMLLVGKFI